MLSGEMPPSAPATQGHRQHSGRRGHRSCQYRLHAGQRYNARTGAQSSLGGKQGCTSVICTARHSQHGAKAALVAVARARRDVVPDKFGCDLG